VLAAKLRDNGLKLLPSPVGRLRRGRRARHGEKIHDVAKLVESGSDAIEKELEQTYENVLARKLATPEGMALIKAKIAEIEGAPAAGPTPAAAPTATPAPTAASAAAPSTAASPGSRRPRQVVSQHTGRTAPRLG